jgi:hypothetical protein
VFAWAITHSCLAPAAPADAVPTLEGPLFSMTGEPPPGFLHLTEPQTVMVDVYFGGRFLVSTLATHTPTRIRFHNAEQVVIGLRDLTNPDLIRLRLSEDLPVNARMICSQSRSSCPAPRPEIADVVFDESKFRVDLFVNRNYLQVRSPVAERFLPPGQGGVTFLQNFSASFAGADDDADNETFIGSFTTLAHRENRLIGIASYTDQDDLTVDRLFAQRDFRGAEYIGGIFRTSGRALTFGGENDLGGIRIASSLVTRTDLAFSRGTPIEVFLSTASRVDIIKDGRLLYSQFYEAGNQILDTSLLPEGAYDITIRIDDGGVQREEVRFFSKTSHLPPLDQPLTSFELGRVLNRNTSNFFPEATDAWLLRVGHSRRLTQGFGIDVGAASTSDERMFELGAFNVGSLPRTRTGYYEVQASSFVGDDGDWGIGLHGLVQLNRFYLGFDFRKVDADPLSPDFDDYRLIPDDLSQRSVNVQVPLFGGFLGLSRNSSRRGNGDRIERSSLTYRRAVYQSQRHVLEVTADFGEIEGDMLALIGVRLNLIGTKLTGNIVPRYRYTDDDFDGDQHGYQLDTSLTWHEPEFYSGDLRVGMNVSKNDIQENLGGQLNYDHRLAYSRLTVNRSEFNGATRTSWAGTVNTSVATNGADTVFGAQNSATSVILVRLEGPEDSDAEFDVLVDGYPRGYAPVGRMTAIHVNPFQTYEVRIRPRLSDFVDFEDRVETVTVYPGNVASLVWKVRDLMVVFGRAMDAGGRAIANARVDGAIETVRTDAYGYFQAEVLRRDDPFELTFTAGERSCTVFAARIEQRQGVGYLDNLTCRLR